MIQRAGIYIHLPFCTAHCSYCDFPISTQQMLSAKYYLALLQEIQIRPIFGEADTLYFGGGTPSLTPLDILRKIRAAFGLPKDAEITLEANPEDVTRKSLAGWIDLGINRLSVGLQSLQDSALRRSHRVHSATKALEALETIRKSGLENFNVDLIIGLPEQTASGFLEDLQQLIRIRPAHFSLYLLEVHERTELYTEVQSGRIVTMNEADQVQCYVEAIRMLEGAGYEHYEVSNFARPGFQCHHNLKYWNGEPYEGYGLGACAYIGGYRLQNVREIGRYIERMTSGLSPIADRVIEDQETRMRNRLIFGLRKRQGVNVVEFEQEFSTTALSLFGKEGTTLLKEGLLELSENYLRLSLNGMLISNEVLSLVV